MKKTLKCFVAFLLSTFLFVFSVLPSAPLTVSASESFPIPKKALISGSVITSDIIHTFTDTLISNYNFIDSGFDTSSSFAFLFVNNNNHLEAWVLKDVGTERLASAYDRAYSCFYSQPFLKCDVNISNGYCNGVNLFENDKFYVNTLCYIDGRYSNGVFRDYGTGGVQGGFDNGGNGYSDYAVFPLQPEFNPIINPLYRYNYSLNVNVEKFTQWLIDTGKYTEISSALVENRVQGLVSIFAKNGANNNSFVDSLKQYFKYISISQYVDDYEVVVNKIRSLYQEFQKQEKDKLMDIFFHRTEKTDNIKPVTNGDDMTLITDTSDDNVIVRILRDILRSLIALPQNMHDMTLMIINNLDGLDNTVNIVNNSGTPFLNELWSYSSDDFNTDLNEFSTDVADIQQLPVSYVSDINNNPLMPEKMLSDKDSLSVNIPNMSGFTVSDDGKTFSTQTTTYNLKSSQYPWLDPLVKKIKRFASILLIIGYLIHLRYKMPEIIRGE